MREQLNSMPVGCSVPEPQGERVTICVPHEHPLLQLKDALDWAAITAVMVKHWREAGRNVDGGVGQPWPVWLYVPVLVLMRVQHLDTRAMERYLAYDAAARVFLGWTSDPKPWVRDHSNIARAEASLGTEGWREVDELIVKHAVEWGFGDPRILSSDTTVQEPQIGYPNEPGILRGVAQRVHRALKKLAKCGVEGVEAGLEKTKEIVRQVKHHHLFAKTNEEKREVLQQLVNQTTELMGECRKIRGRAGQVTHRVVRSGIEKLEQMAAFCAVLLPQILHWLATGTVAAGKLLHAGITEARAIVKNKAGKKTEFGFKWLIHRIGGGYIFGKRVGAQADENKMPLEAVKDYRGIFGLQATPEMSVYDRGGSAKKTVEELQRAGVEKVGIVPKGKAQGSVAEEEQKEVMSQRGQTEGSIGTLKRYGFSGRRERSNQTVEAAGQRAMVSLNLNKRMRDLGAKDKQARKAAA
jgi:hypothetical protein